MRTMWESNEPNRLHYWKSLYEVLQEKPEKGNGEIRRQEKMKSSNIPDYTNKGFNSFNSFGAVLHMKKEEKNQNQFGIFKEHVKCTNSLIEEHTGLRTEVQHYIVINGLTAKQIEGDEYVKKLSERMLKIVGDVRTLFSNRLLGIFGVVK